VTGIDSLGDIDSIEELWGPAQSLLPDNATVLETALEMADAARYPLAAGDVIRCKDPNECPEAILPVLAWERSTDLWDDGWDLAKKRYVTSRAIAMQKMKGTAAGIKEYVRVMGGTVTKIAAPPEIAAPDGPLDADQMAEWLSQFPRLRSYQYALEGNSPFISFAPDLEIAVLDGSDDYSGGLPGTPAGAPFSTSAFYPVYGTAVLYEPDLTQYIGGRTALVQNGVETPVDVFTTVLPGADGVMTSYNQAVLPGSLSGVAFADNVQTDANGYPLVYDGELAWFAVDIDLIAVRTVTTLEDQVDYGSDNWVFTSTPVSPGLSPLTVKPEMVFQQGPVFPYDCYPDLVPASAPVIDGEWGRFLPEDRSPQYIYQQIYLYNPAPGAAPPAMPQGARSFVGNDWLDFPPYTAQVTVEMFGELSPASFAGWYGDGFLADPDMTFMWNMLNAVRASVSARDLILVNTTTYSEAVPDNSLLCGSITCGDIVQIRN
jgi:phage tail P2-like protein